MKSLFLFFLGSLARLIILRHKPFVVGITGSVGKTTTRHFIAEFLKEKQANFYTAEGNYNGEFGLPLTIIQARSGGRNPLKWIAVFLKGFSQLFSKSYPKLLILEYGIDRVGEMDFMCRIVEPDIAVYTVLSANHIAQFGTAQRYFDEKMHLSAQKRKKAQMVITNDDDPEQGRLAATHTFGRSEGSDLRILSSGHTSKGLKMIFDLTSRDLETSTIRDTIVEQASSQGEHTLQTRFFGEHNATTLAPAILALVGLGYEMDDIARFFEKVDLPCGRGNTLVGRKGSIVIDGTYNGGFASITAGLSMLADLGRQLGRPTIAIIGDMRELGDLEESYHQELAHLSKTLDLDNFIFVGPMCSTYIQPLFPDANYTLDAREAGEIVLKGVKNALIFAKGSQNTIFLEEALKQIILPEDSPKLVRQSEDWMGKKEAFYDSL